MEFRIKTSKLGEVVNLHQGQIIIDKVDNEWSIIELCHKTKLDDEELLKFQLNFLNELRNEVASDEIKFN